MPKTPKSYEFDQAVIQHRTQLNRILDKRALKIISKNYDNGLAKLEKQLFKIIGKKKDIISSIVAKNLIYTTTQNQLDIIGQVIEDLKAASHETAVESSQLLTKSLERIDGKKIDLPINKLIEKRRNEITTAHENSSARLGARITGNMKDSIVKSVMTGESHRETIDKVIEIANKNFWQIERILNTELAYSFNSVRVDTIKELSNESPGLMLRWNEMVSDDGAFTPHDHRVAKDSIAMHGQVTDVGGVFTMPSISPNGDMITPTLVGQSWAFSPSRPFDRAMIMPWKATWGVMGWKYNNDQRQYIVRP